MTINQTSVELRKVSPIYATSNPYKRVGKANPFFKASNAHAMPVAVLFKAPH